jgi:hypothetical protein
VRNPKTGEYTLSYEDVNYVVKELAATSLNTLSSAMSRSGDFSATAFNEVRAQAALIPAVVLANIGQTDAFFGTIKKALTDFYLNPTITNYNTVRDIHALFMRRAWNSQDPFFSIMNSSYFSVLVELNSQLAGKVSSDARQEKYAMPSLTQTQIRALTVTR